MASLPEQCCTLPPSKSDYVPTGKTIKLPVDEKELDVYVTGPTDAKHCVVGVYDIFGMHNNTLRGADSLAKEGQFKVVVPDLFHGKAWPLSNFPPKEGRPVLNAWIQEQGAWDKVRPSLLAVVEELKQQGATSIGAYGLCFGAKKLAQGADLQLFKAIALLHPSFWQPQDADNMTAPLALLPSQGEDQAVMNEFWDRIQKKPFADQCIRHDFLDVHHGFASARADYADPELAKRATEAYAILTDFFKARL